MRDTKAKKIRKVIGVISDTHGLLRPEAIKALWRVDLILHAGDVGTAEVLKRLKATAPLIAVRGNNDKGPWAAKLPCFKAKKILYLNPGSAGPRRFRLPVSLARLTVDGKAVKAELVNLSD